MRRRTFSALLTAGLLPASRVFSVEPAADDKTAGCVPCTAITRGTSPVNVHAAAWIWSTPRPSMSAITDLDFHTVPAAVKPGQKVELFFQVPASRHGRGRQKVRSRARAAISPVRDRPGHGVLSAHPSGGSPDGTWTIERALPKAGYYKVLSDFLPAAARRSSSRVRWSPRAMLAISPETAPILYPIPT